MVVSKPSCHRILYYKTPTHKSIFLSIQITLSTYILTLGQIEIDFISLHSYALKYSYSCCIRNKVIQVSFGGGKKVNRSPLLSHLWCGACHSTGEPGTTTVSVIPVTHFCPTTCPANGLNSFLLLLRLQE